jgi:hypothetical protein
MARKFEYSACYTPPPIPIRRRWPRSPLGLLRRQTCSMHSMLVHYPLRGSFPALRFVSWMMQTKPEPGAPDLRTDCLIGRQAPGATVMSPPQAVRPAALVSRVSLASRRSFSGPCRAVLILRNSMFRYDIIVDAFEFEFIFGTGWSQILKILSKLGDMA